MTNEELSISDATLIARPLDEEFDTMMEVQRNPHGAWQAIQTLTEQLTAAHQDANEAEAYAEELEAKLAKAVGGLKRICRQPDYMFPSPHEIARATLEELKGESHE